MRNQLGGLASLRQSRSFDSPWQGGEDACFGPGMQSAAKAAPVQDGRALGDVGERLDHDFAMMAGGVNEIGRRRASSRHGLRKRRGRRARAGIVGAERLAERLAAGRCRAARRMPQRASDNLDQARAVDARDAAAAEQIGRADQPFGDRHRILLDRVDRTDVREGDEAADRWRGSRTARGRRRASPSAGVASAGSAVVRLGMDRRLARRRRDGSASADRRDRSPRHSRHNDRAGNSPRPSRRRFRAPRIPRPAAARDEGGASVGGRRANEGRPACRSRGSAAAHNGGRNLAGERDVGNVAAIGVDALVQHQRRAAQSEALSRAGG